MERPARRHLLQIYQTLDRVEDADHADRIEQQRQRLNALQPGDKEAAEEEPSAPSDGGGDAEATSDDSSDSNSGSGNGEASDEGGESEESSSGEEG